MMGKLIVDVGVTSGGLYGFGLDRGFHVYGGNMSMCTLTYDDLEENGNCRLEEFDGVDRSTQFDRTPDDCLLGRLRDALVELHTNFP
jgi:hypothetical protein